MRRQFSQFFGEIIEPAIGLTVEVVILGFRQVQTVITDRVNQSIELATPLMERHEAWQRRKEAGATKKELADFGFAPETARAAELLMSSFETQENLLRFTSQDLSPKLGDRSRSFLNAFSFLAGQVNQSLSTPNDEDEVRRRPFACIGEDSYVLLDVAYCSFAPLRRLLECFDTERKR